MPKSQGLSLRNVQPAERPHGAADGSRPHAGDLDEGVFQGLGVVAYKTIGERPAIDNALSEDQRGVCRAVMVPKLPIPTVQQAAN